MVYCKIHPISFNIEVATYRRLKKVLNYLMYRQHLNKVRNGKTVIVDLPHIGSFKFANFTIFFKLKKKKSYLYN